MKSRSFNAHNKHIILKRGYKSGNISETCDLFGISRTTYYNWKKDYEKYGFKGLEPKERKKPNMPNKVNKFIEEEILNYVLKHPEDGPRRIYYDMKAEGYEVGETGIYNVLRRNNLSRRKEREEYSKRKKHIYIEKDKSKYLDEIFVEDKFYPGYLIVQKIDYIGRFKNIGEIYQYTIYDLDSNWAEVKVYNKQMDIDVWGFFERKMIYLAETFHLNIENLIIDKNKKFLDHMVQGDRYLEIIESFQMEHMFMNIDEYDRLKDIIEFNEYINKKLYKPLYYRDDINSFEKLENELKKIIREYNFEMKITNGRNKGSKPVELILDRAAENNVNFETLPIWLMAMIKDSGGDKLGK